MNRRLKKLPHILLALVVGVVGVAVPATYVQAADPNFLDVILSPISALLITLGGAMVGVAGVMLNYSVQVFVIEMGQLGANEGIEAGWRLIRDIVNLTFVFGLIYVGVITILRGENNNTRTWLIRIIIGALLVNFSLFFAKAIIDLSNLAATEIYDMHDGTEVNLSDRFMDYMGIQNNLATFKITAEEVAVPPFLQAVIFLLMTAVTAFVFGTAAILLIIRFAVLLFLMISSPVMFIAPFLPAVGGLAKRWWDALIGQALFAPAFMLTTYLALEVVKYMPNAFRSDVSMVGAAQPITDGSSLVGTAMSYSIMMVLLVAGIVIAKKLGAYGASAALSWGESFGKKAGGALTLGLGARVGRSTVGRLGYKVSEKEGLKEAAAKKGFRGTIARATLSASRGVGGASFDARQVGGMGKKLGIGEGAKGGYEGRVKARQKKEEAFAKSLGTLDETDTYVKIREDEVTAQEQNVRRLREAQRAIRREDFGTDEEFVDAKAAAQEEVVAAERNLNEKRQQVEKEKMRRQLGTTFVDTDAGRVDYEIRSAQQELESKKTALKDALSAWHRNKTAENAKNIEESQKAIEESKKKLASARYAVGAGGYAGTLENARRFEPMLWGSNRHIDREAGKALRKAYEKKTKKTKEEKNFDTIAEAVSKKE